MTAYNLALEFNLDSKGELKAGIDADINVLDRELNLEATYSYGRLLN